MQQTLGEKLRLAREERGISLSEVAEQTRISPHYLQAIENDDYRTLPGGIFNKGFIKSFAKFVGVDETEALSDYTSLTSTDDNVVDEPALKVYRPEVLTDDRSGGSMIPTVIGAVVILGLLTGGILWGLNYLNQPSGKPAANTSVNSSPAPGPGASPATDPTVPTMANLSVEMKSISAPVKVMATVDAEAPKAANIAAGSSVTFAPKDSLTLNYSRWNFDKVQLLINGKPIGLPTEPLDAKDRDRIIFVISKDNLAEIWARGSISTASAPVITDSNANIGANTPAAPTVGTTPPTAAQPRATPIAKPSVAANTSANSVVKPPDAKPIDPGKPPTMTGKPPANKPN